MGLPEHLGLFRVQSNTVFPSPSRSLHHEETSANRCHHRRPASLFQRRQLRRRQPHPPLYRKRLHRPALNYEASPRGSARFDEGPQHREPLGCTFATQNRRGLFLAGELPAPRNASPNLGLALPRIAGCKLPFPQLYSLRNLRFHRDDALV